MPKTNIGNWLQIAANVGMLAGLVLVAIQISQTNSLTGYQLNTESYDSYISTATALVGENPEAAMYRVLVDSKSATDQDYFVADHFYRAQISQIHRLVYLSRGELGGENDFHGSLRTRAGYFACPYGLAYLDQLIEAS